MASNASLLATTNVGPSATTSPYTTTLNTTDGTSNNYTQEEVISMGISMLTISLSAIIGNSIVVWILPQVSTISSTTKTVLLSLAVTDIGSGLTWLLSALEAFAEATGGKSILRNHEHICFMQGLLFLIFVDVSLMSQAIIAVDRLLILTRKKKWTSKVVRMRGIVIGSWIIGSAWCIYKATLSDDHEKNYYTYDENTFLCQKLHEPNFLPEQIVGMVMFVSLPLFITIAAYGRIAFLLKKLVKRRRRREIDRGVIHMMVAIVAVFYIFAALYMMLGIVNMKKKEDEKVAQLDFAANVALSATCSVNFVIYLRMNVGFRKKAKENLQWLFKTVCPCCLSLPEDDGSSAGGSMGSTITVIGVRKQLRRRAVNFREEEPEIIIPRDPFIVPRISQDHADTPHVIQAGDILDSIDYASTLTVIQSANEIPQPPDERATMCRGNEGSMLRSMSCTRCLTVTHAACEQADGLGDIRTISQRIARESETRTISQRIPQESDIRTISQQIARETSV